MIAARAVAVGFACALAHNAIMIAGDWVGLHYSVSLVISFILVVVLGYSLHSGWTFAAAERSRSSFGRYALVASANFPASLAGMFVLVDLAALPVAVSSLALTVLLFAMNFFANRWALRAYSRRQT